MRTILYLIQKEFIQIFRNRGMLPIIFGMPFVQLIILSNAATFDVKHISLHIIDSDQSSYSRRLVGKFTSGHFFKIADFSFDESTAEENLLSSKASLIIKIPLHWSRDLIRDGNAKLQFIINSEDGSTAGITQSYAASIAQSFTQEILLENGISVQSPIQIETRFWYNPELNYKWYMIPGILVALVTLIGLFLSGMNVVREKEIGTIEQINVTPITKPQFIIGKLFPFWIIGLFELAGGLVIAKLIFSLPILGSIGIVFAVAGIYLVLVLGIGLLISTATETQQQAMFLAWFFMVILLLLGGLFTPLDSMPEWAQKTMWVNPIALFIRIMRLVLLKGSGWNAIWPYVITITGLAIFFLSAAVLRYRKTSE